MLKFIFIMLAFSLLLSCSDEPQYVIEAYRMMNKFNQELSAKGFLPVGVGGYLSKDIEKYSLSYNYYIQSMNLEISRELLVDATELILFTVNNDIAARPFLRNFPFNENNLYINIVFLNNGNRLPPPDIANVILSNGNVIYFHEVNDKPVKIAQESYAEAYQKAKGVPLPDRSNL